jgi:hypothetical protein
MLSFFCEPVSDHSLGNFDLRIQFTQDTLRNDFQANRNNRASTQEDVGYDYGRNYESSI